MKLFVAVMPLFVVGISMVHYHQVIGTAVQSIDGKCPVFCGYHFHCLTRRCASGMVCPPGGIPVDDDVTAIARFHIDFILAVLVTVEAESCPCKGLLMVIDLVHVQPVGENPGRPVSSAAFSLSVAL